MDHTKSIKNELIDIWTPGQKNASLAWYDRAKRESDIIKEDYYTNCAIFRNKSIAHQETLKLYQKDFKNKVFSHDSGSVIVYFNTSKVGIDILRIRKENSTSLDSDGLNPRLVCDSSRGHQWMPEYSREDSIDNSMNIYSFFKNISNRHKSIKLVVAWILYTSQYDKTMSLEWLEFWKQEFRFLEVVSELYGSVHKQCLWIFTNYSRHRIRRSFRVVTIKFAEYLGIDIPIDDLDNLAIMCSICNSNNSLVLVRDSIIDEDKIYLCKTCKNRRSVNNV